MAVLDRTAWMVAPPDRDAGALADALGVPPLVAAVLRRRGAGTPEAAREFLHPSLERLSDPFQMPAMREAVETAARALRSGRRIAIHGDYDVDGISAAAILLRGLRTLGADPLWYLPHRLRDGYGLGIGAVEALAAAGAGVLIAADCGITAVEAVGRARALGLEAVIIDHHAAPGQRAPATIVEPPRGAAAGPCAAGLAFLFLWALRTHLGQRPAMPAGLVTLAALGTVADVVPLLHDNRRLVAAGLAQMRAAPAAGVAALIEDAGIQGPVETWQIGWQLGPRLNAPGRLGDPAPALRLLLTDDPGEARRLARDLGEANRERQAILDRALAEATVQAEADPSAPAFVLAGEGWHPGVVGLVAGRIAEQYRRPAVAIALEGTVGRGSARSVEGFNLIEALGGCGEHLARFGGHAMAAGLSIAASAVPGFRHAFQEAAASGMPRAAAPLQVDAEMALSDLTAPLVTALAQLEPFGPGNPHPVLAVRGVRPVTRRLLGDGKHIRIGVTDGASFVEAIGFAMAAWGELLAFTDAAVDLAFVPELDRFEPGRVRLRLRAMEVPGVDPEAVLADTGLLVDRLFRRAADYLSEDRYDGVEDAPALYTKVVGVTFDERQVAIAAVTSGERLELRREPANPHDAHAIRVVTGDGRMLGYLNARLAGRLAPSIDAGARYRVVASRTTGGGDRTLGLNLYIERHEEDPVAGVAAAHRRAWRGLGVRAAMDRLPIYLTGGRPLRPSHAEALGVVAGRGSVVLAVPLGRGRAAAVSGGAALAALNGRCALVVEPLASRVVHRAEQLSSRLHPLGLRIVPVHGLQAAGDRERAMAALRADAADVVVASVEALRGGMLPGSWDRRVETVVLDGLSARDLGALPPLLAERPALILTEAPTAWAVARAWRGATVVRDPLFRPPVQIADRRNAGNRDAVVEEVVSAGEKTLVYAVSAAECVRVAARLRERGGERTARTGYLHEGLPARLRQIVTQAFREGRVQVLVATAGLDEEALPPDLRQLVAACLPGDRGQFCAMCRGAGLDRRPVTVTVAFGREDAGVYRRLLDERAPGRDALAGIYRALREWRGETPFCWPDDEAWARVHEAAPGVARAAVGAACVIFEEAGVAARESIGDRWQVQLTPSAGRRDLGASLRYREGRRERDAFEAFAAWAERAAPEEMQRAIRG